MSSPVRALAHRVLGHQGLDLVEDVGVVPVDDLQPYVAAVGHVVVMRADGSDFAHEHAEVEDAHGSRAPC